MAYEAQNSQNGSTLHGQRVNLFRGQKVKGRGHTVIKYISIAASYSPCTGTLIYAEGRYWITRSEAMLFQRGRSFTLPPI